MTKNIRYLQTENTDEGTLQVNVETPSGRLPVEDATAADTLYNRACLYLHQKGATREQIDAAYNEGRIQELARIMGGDSITQLVLQNAEEMLRLSGN